MKSSDDLMMVRFFWEFKFEKFQIVILEEIKFLLYEKLHCALELLLLFFYNLSI